MYHLKEVLRLQHLQKNEIVHALKLYQEYSSWIKITKQKTGKSPNYNTFKISDKKRDNMTELINCAKSLQIKLAVFHPLSSLTKQTTPHDKKLYGLLKEQRFYMKSDSNFQLNSCSLKSPVNPDCDSQPVQVPSRDEESYVVVPESNFRFLLAHSNKPLDLFFNSSFLPSNDYHFNADIEAKITGMRRPFHYDSMMEDSSSVSQSACTDLPVEEHIQDNIAGMYVMVISVGSNLKIPNLEPSKPPKTELRTYRTSFLAPKTESRTY